LKEVFFVVSKDNEWSASLVDNLSKKFECRYYNDVSYIEDIPRLNPSWIFFFHWSDIVSSQVHANNRCVVIHTGNLPRNRGGSPLQNQIMEGIVDSRVNAIQMVEEVDAGDVYCSLPITLQGNLTDIWMAISQRAYDLICECVESSPTPKKQEGEKQVYRRRRDNRIEFHETSNLRDIYDQIRMLDSKEYPTAYLVVNDFKLEFSRSKFEGEEIISDVRITKR